MRRIPFAGGWYADALPSGEFAVLMPGSHLITHQGNAPLPQGDEPLYHRITTIGGFQIAGQGHYQNVTWWWTADHGWVRKPVAVGVSPVIFDNLGDLHIATPEIEAHIGSQGWRYVSPSGLLITGDATYGPVQGLSEFTNLSDTDHEASLLIGQSHDDNHDGALIADVTRDDKGREIVTHRLLEPGPCRFIRAARSGDQVAVAIWKPQFGAVLYWLTVAELRALPIVQAVPPMLPPKPIPEPAPTPEPKPVSIVPDRSAFVRDFVGPRLARLGSLDETRAHTFEAVNACCAGLRLEDSNWGVLEKTGGDRVTDRAADILLYALDREHAQVVDVVGDAEGKDGPPTVSWTLKDIRPISQWKLPYPAESTPSPAPIPAQPSPDAIAVALATIVLGLGDQRAALERIEARLTAIEALEHAPLTPEQTEAIRTALAGAVTFPAYSGKVLGQTLTLRPGK